MHIERANGFPREINKVAFSILYSEFIGFNENEC